MAVDSPIRQRERDLTNKLDKAMIVILSRIVKDRVDIKQFAPSK